MRTKSKGSFLLHRATSCPSSVGRSNRLSGNSRYGYLGENIISSPSEVRKTLRLLPSSPLGKSPRPHPHQTRETLDAVLAGLKEAVLTLQEDIQQKPLPQSQEAEDELVSLKLELGKYGTQLSELEWILQEYELALKLRQGVRRMGVAYGSYHGKHTLALANVKAGLTECSQLLASLETQLQPYLGTFHLTIQGIQGFARLCTGDVYEIGVRHGHQKWKTRTKVGTGGSQRWQGTETKMRALLGQPLVIKGVELKGLLAVGKTLQLANKTCQIESLFSWQPQLMTLNLNPSGSLKLSVIVRWDPLGQVESAQNFGDLSPARGTLSMGGLGASSSNVSSTASRDDLCTPIARKQSPLTLEGEGFHGDELRESLNQLANILLDEIQGQYPELQVAEVNIGALKGLLIQQEEDDVTGYEGEEDGIPHPGFKPPSSLLTIQTALESFDFLDSSELLGSTQEVTVAPQEPLLLTSSSHPHEGPSFFEHVETGRRTMDSGISSLNSTSSAAALLNTGLTGSGQLDLTLSTHISISLSLVNALGTFGPLKWKEKTSLSGLQEQGVILGAILHRVNLQEQQIQLDQNPELLSFPFIKNLWEEITGNGSIICAKAEWVLSTLKSRIEGILGPDSYSGKEDVAGVILGQMREGVPQDHTHLITLFQFISFLKPYENSFPTLVNDILREERLLLKLNPEEDETSITKTLEGLLQEALMPSKRVMTALTRLLGDSNLITKRVQHFISELAKSRRREVVECSLELLESDEKDERCLGLELLKLLDGVDTLQEVAYLSQTDPEVKVRNRATSFLQAHRQGDKLIAQLTLHSHGFQGLLN